MAKNGKKDPNEEVIIKVKAWQVQYVLGAMRLGIWVEDWCGALGQTAIGTYDTHSGKWILCVGSLIDEIKKQSGITEEDKQYADYGWLEEIGKWVEKQCQINEKNIDKWQQAQHEEHLERLKTDKKYKKEHEQSQKRMKKQVVSVKITDEMMAQAKGWAARVQSEKR